MKDNDNRKPPEEGNISAVIAGIAQKLKVGSEVLAGSAESGRSRLDKISTKRDIDKLYWKLGKEIVALVSAGEIKHPGVVERADRIEKLIERLNQIPRE